MPNPRLAVLSDIHGNPPALDAVLADLQAFSPIDAVLVAGDIITPLYHETVLQKLCEMRAVMIRGNGEHNLLEMHDGAAPDYYWTAQQFALARWNFSHVSPADVEYIRALPEQVVFHLPGTDPIRIVHGSPRGINDGVSPVDDSQQFADAMALIDEPVVIFGHTHQPWQQPIDGRLALNPGAVTGPLNNQVGAQYAILEWQGGAWQARLRCIAYDLQATAQIFKDSGLLDTGHLARCFLASIFSGYDVARKFLTYAFTLARHMGYRHLPYIPDEVWDHAGKTFPWPPDC